MDKRQDVNPAALFWIPANPDIGLLEHIGDEE